MSTITAQRVDNPLLAAAGLMAVEVIFNGEKATCWTKEEVAEFAGRIIPTALKREREFGLFLSEVSRLEQVAASMDDLVLALQDAAKNAVRTPHMPLDFTPCSDSRCHVGVKHGWVTRGDRGFFAAASVENLLRFLDRGIEVGLCNVHEALCLVNTAAHSNLLWTEPEANEAMQAILRTKEQRLCMDGGEDATVKTTTGVVTMVRIWTPTSTALGEPVAQA